MEKEPAQKNHPPGSNIPEFSVSDLAFSLKKTLEDQYGRVRVRGELSRVSIAGSGHMYSSLKDDKAVLDAVCWKGVMNRLSIKPEEGLEVICTGKISSYPGSSKYQLIIESMELAGEGALLKMLEDRRKKLEAEGLFAPDRKKQLPFIPQTIGIVTSPTGAVIRDIIHRITDRFPRNLILWPVLVQGKGAAEQIAAAINGFQTIDQHNIPKPDLLIIGRGGGSLEDLMAFNEEIVIRAIANSEIPIISAVGHETDTTLADFAADQRAPTPTGAAEISVPVRAQLIAQILDDEHRLIAGASRLIDQYRTRIQSSARGLGDPTRILQIKSQTLDSLSDKISTVFKHYLSEKQTRLLKRAGQITHPKSRLDQATQNLERWNDQLITTRSKITKDLESKLNHAGKMLEAYSFENVLKRGYAVIRNKDGKLITNTKTAKEAENFQIQFQDNDILDAQIIGAKGKQGTLF